MGCDRCPGSPGQWALWGPEGGALEESPTGTQRPRSSWSRTPGRGGSLCEVREGRPCSGEVRDLPQQKASQEVTERQTSTQKTVSLEVNGIRDVCLELVLCHWPVASRLFQPQHTESNMQVRRGPARTGVHTRGVTEV